MRFFFILLLTSTFTFASLNKASSILKKRMNYETKLKYLVDELVGEGLYYSAIPWAKEYLAISKKRRDARFEATLSKLLKKTGTKQFETLPTRYLEKSGLNNIQYILAKKLIKLNKLGQAKSVLERINPSHSIFPYAQNALGSVYSIQNKHELAVQAFNMCISSTKIKGDAISKKQAMTNRDLCLAGVARAQFAARNFIKAEEAYLDIPKSSPVWPSILFEEAWNSYYLKKYNRTLGKLVTYKAPIFKPFFNPEFEVLEALSYFKLCLYDDAKKVSDNFYKKYMDRTRKLRVFLKNKGKDYNYFYKLYANYSQRQTTGNSLLDSLIRSFSTEPAIFKMKNSLALILKEYDSLKRKSSSRIVTALKKNVLEVLKTQRRIIGSYVRSRLIEKYAELYRGFEGMSYIKLEVLDMKKQRLYNFSDKKKAKRGKFEYLKRNERQYFWDFNGEFWADELGDYVFALRSEC